MHSAQRAKAVGLFTGFLLIALISWGLWTAFLRAAIFFERANPPVAAAVIGLMATVGGGLVITSLTQVYTRNRDREEAHRAKKVEIYAQFVELVRRTVAQENEFLKEPPFQDGELVRELAKFKRDLILWGSPKVISTQLQFEIEASESGKALVAVNRLLLAIREDIGLTNRGLNNFELMKLQIKQED